MEKRGNVETASRNVPFSDVANAVEEGAGTKHDGGAVDVLAFARDDAVDGFVGCVHFEFLRMRRGREGQWYMGTVFDDREIGVVSNRLLHVFFVQITIHLRTRTVHLGITIGGCQ